MVISLEPVIDLFSGKTAHYRLHHAIEGAEQGLSAERPRRPAARRWTFTSIAKHWCC
jgi:hypothetical protein